MKNCCNAKDQKGEDEQARRATLAVNLNYVIKRKCLERAGIASRRAISGLCGGEILSLCKEIPIMEEFHKEKRRNEKKIRISDL